MDTRLIALSGIDGAGKSTQLNLIKKHFEKNGKSVICLWTRGGSTSGINGLKDFIRKFAGKRLPPSGHSNKRDQMLKKLWIQRLWLSLAILDLLRIYTILLRWWFVRGKLVICDRFLWDTLIDFKLMFPGVLVKDWLLWKILVWFTPVPDKSVLLIIPLNESEKRCSQKHDPFPDTPIMRKERYKLYETESNMHHWEVIDSTMSVNLVFEKIIGDT